VNDAAVEVEDLRRSYGSREALAGLSFSVRRGELFALLGPNGGGKSTLFKILTTLLPPSAGTARVCGHDVRTAQREVRRHIGVVFQHPSVDGKLTIGENLRHQGHLYGLSGAPLKGRIDELLDRFDLVDRKDELVERLSGGLARRAELAKGLLPRPSVLLLDEPSTGLDPGARRDLLDYLRRLRDDDGMTVVLTTHYLEEAERCDRVGVIDRGKLVALDAPNALTASVGGDVVVVQPSDIEGLRAKMRERFGLEAVRVDGTLRLEHARGHELVRDLVDAFPDDVHSITFGKPTLEDVFVRLTGRRLFADETEA
jgi:ABC-2 type transport system ATP-binding protein